MPVSLLESRRQQAALVVIALGLGLAIALWPYFTALIAIPVLYVVFRPLHRWLMQRRLGSSIAAGITLLVAALLILIPGASVLTLLATGGQDLATDLLRGPFIDKLQTLRIGQISVGAELQRLGSALLTWLGQSAVSLLGTAARTMIQLTITFFGLYYMLVTPGTGARGIVPYIPFSSDNARAILKRFQDVTVSTLIGVFATAALQGILVGVAFWAAGLSNAAFWGVVTVIVAILPVVGSGLVWLPAVGLLFYSGRTGWAIGLAAWGLLVVGQVDNIVRPWVFSRYAKVHPFVTVLGAFAGVARFGLIGLILGPLAISYFFELLKMYREEYIEGDRSVDSESSRVLATAP